MRLCVFFLLLAVFVSLCVSQGLLLRQTVPSLQSIEPVFEACEKENTLYCSSNKKPLKCLLEITRESLSPKCRAALLGPCEQQHNQNCASWRLGSFASLRCLSSLTGIDSLCAGNLKELHQEISQAEHHVTEGECPTLGPPQYGRGSCAAAPPGGICTQKCAWGPTEGTEQRTCQNGSWSSLTCSGLPWERLQRKDVRAAMEETLAVPTSCGGCVEFRRKDEHGEKMAVCKDPIATLWVGVCMCSSCQIKINGDAPGIYSCEDYCLRGSTNLPLPPKNPLPKIIHQVWYGAKKRPADVMDSCKNMYEAEGYQYVLWDDAALERLKDQFPWVRTAEGLKQSDLVRVIIVANFGGMFFDADSQCIRPITHILDNVRTDCMGVYERDGALHDIYGFKGNLLANGYLACHPLSKTALALMQALTRPAQDDKNVGAWITHGPRWLGDFVQKHPGSFTVFSNKAFMPVHWTEFRRQPPLEDTVPDNADFTYAYNFEQWGSSHAVYTVKLHQLNIDASRQRAIPFPDQP